MNTVYADRKGRLWILVAHTRSGVVAGSLNYCNCEVTK